MAALALLALLMMAIALPLGAHAQDSAQEVDSAGEPDRQVVRVGWYDSPFNNTDQFGRRFGYAYEYQRKIAAYTGWTYEYVEGSWSECVEMLKEGKIDLMSDVSYTEERAEDMLYASLPMGTEAYYLFVASDNQEIVSSDISSLDGKKVGVTKDSFQEGEFLKWAKAHGVRAKLVELTCPEDESLAKMEKGEIDAFITLDAYGTPGANMPVFKIGSSDFYFAVSKARPDLLNVLDLAMSRIQDENRYYNQQLNEKYLANPGSNLYLSPEEARWLSRHGTIKVGYQDNYLAFCASDERTGELTGALKDYLAAASTGFENANLNFEAIAYPTAGAALEALRNGEVDCMFPANLTEYDGETMGLVMTPPLMRSEMDAVVRAADQKEFVRKKQVTVAVNEGNTNYEMWLAGNFPDWQIAYFPDTPAGLDAVAAGEADCVVISSYRFSNISKQCERLHLGTVYTGVDMDYFLALREGDTELYSILTKVTDIVPDSVINASLTYYSTEDVKTSFSDLVKDNLFIIMTVIAVVLLLILLLLLRSVRAERKAREEERLVSALNKRVFVDALTSVRNKGAFDDFLQDVQNRIDNEGLRDVAVGVFDCDDLKAVNDEHGHDKGDEYLKVASRLICRIFDHSPVFRIGGDEFAVVLLNKDFENREQLASAFAEEQRAINAAAQNSWEEAHVASGIAVFDPQLDRSIAETSRRADKIMYENKRLGKAALNRDDTRRR